MLKTKKRTYTWYFLLPLMLMLLAMIGNTVSSRSLAAPPDHAKGGGGNDGGDGTTLSGTIYFRRTTLWTMDANGNNQEEILPYFPAPAEPSYLDTPRWFLTVTETDGTYPSGWPHHEVAAVDENGAGVFTFSEPAFQPSNSVGSVRWAQDDSSVSVIGLRWDLATEEVIDAGIYVWEVDSANGTLTNGTLVVESGVIETEWGPFPNIYSHDWKADGTAVVYNGGDGVFVEDLVTGEVTMLLADGGAPAWSADDWIAFESYDGGFYRVEAIYVDGSGRKTLAEIKWSANGISFVGAPSWSPDGSHLIYFYQKERGGKLTSEIHRVTADGGNDTVLADRARPVGWR